MKVIIPSYKRPDRVYAATYLPEAYICIAEDEFEAYKANYGSNRLIVMPPGVQGNIARVRNWILNNVDNDEIVMMDDDVRYLSRTNERECHPLEANQAMDFFENGFLMAEDMGVYLWGMNVTPDRIMYCEYTPFSTQAPILATTCCIRRNPLRYDERIPFKEDYDYFLQHLKKYRKTLRFNMYHYHPDHIIGSGGCITNRTMDAEKEQAMILQKKWGSNIVKVDFGRSINPIVKSPLAGI
jgi:glycosyltransferase involved in cell wall biosynthesis